MKMKYFLGALLSFMISVSAFAQGNLGSDYLSLGEIKLAKDYFTKKVAESPAESYYYLGEIAFQEGNLAEARANFEKGLAADPESALNAIGLAKLDLKPNTKEADNQLSAILKKNKKDVNVILAIAKAYLDNGMKEQALAKVQEARKADKKSPAIYIFEGDLLAKEGKAGDAAMQYDQAINFDANSVLAYVKGARVYESINSKTAIDLLKKAIEIRPDFKIAQKYLGQLYSTNGFYPEAIAAYKEYFSGGDYMVEDVTRYAAAEYFTKDYNKAVSLITEGLKLDPNSFVLNRLLMYSKNELKDFEAGLAAGEKFFSIPRTGSDTAKYIIQDYMTFGNILSETGNKVRAIEQFKKAIELDPSKIELNKEVAAICANENMNVEAALFYQKYIELAGEKAEATDFFQLGRYFYYAGSEMMKSEDEAVKAEGAALLAQADAAFATVGERIPDSYLGHYWRARTNALLDPTTEKGLAKPYYEKTIEVLLAKEDADNNRTLIEAYSYLSYYYYLLFDKSKKAEDKANVRLYAGKVLELDPENANGKALFEFANSK